MKRISVIVIMAMYCCLALGQNVESFYYDNEGNDVGIKEFADYYRLVQVKEGFPRVFRDFYVSGEPLRTGGKIVALDNNGGFIVEGKIKEYYKSGSVRCEYILTQGKKNGPYLEYFENGKPKSSAEFVNDELNGLLVLFNEEGVRYEKQFVMGKPETEWFCVYNEKGNMSRVDDEGNPFYLPPSEENYFEMLSRGQLWQTYYDGIINISAQVHPIYEFGSYYRVDLFIFNNSLETIKFDPNKISVRSKDAYGQWHNCVSVSENSFKSKIDKRNRTKASWYAAAQQVAASSAGSEYSTTYYSNGGTSYSSSYNKADALYGQQVANNNIRSYERSLAHEMSVLSADYLAETDLPSNYYLSGFMLFEKNLEDECELSIVLNEITYKFCITDVYRKNHGSFDVLTELDSIGFSLALSPMVSRFLDNGGSAAELSGYETSMLSDLNGSQLGLRFLTEESPYSMVFEFLSADEDDGDYNGRAYLYDNTTLEKLASQEFSGDGGKGSSFNYRFEKSVHDAAKQLAKYLKRFTSNKPTLQVYSAVNLESPIGVSIIFSPSVKRLLNERGSLDEIETYKSLLIRTLNNFGVNSFTFSDTGITNSIVLNIVDADEDDGTLRGNATVLKNETGEELKRIKIDVKGGAGKSFNQRIEKSIPKAARRIISSLKDQ